MYTLSLLECQMPLLISTEGFITLQSTNSDLEFSANLMSALKKCHKVANNVLKENYTNYETLGPYLAFTNFKLLCLYI